MKRQLALVFFLFVLYHVAECGVTRNKRQSIPQIANGELITSIFQIPIQTLGAVRDLLHTTRGRLQAAGQAYQALQAAHPNHRPNPHFVYDRYGNNNNSQQQNYNRRRVYNSKSLVQPRNNGLHEDHLDKTNR